MTLLTNDVIVTTKLVLWGLATLSVMGGYAFLRALNCSPFIAAAATVAYANTPLYGWIIGTVGNYPSLLLVTAATFLLTINVLYKKQQNIANSIFYQSHTTRIYRNSFSHHQWYCRTVGCRYFSANFLKLATPTFQAMGNITICFLSYGIYYHRIRLAAIYLKPRSSIALLTETQPSPFHLVLDSTTENYWA